MNTRIVSLFFVSAIAIIVTGCHTPGMTFRGPVNEGGEHKFSPMAENWGLDYHQAELEKFGRDAQRADLAYMKAQRIGEQFANLKRTLMGNGLSETQASYVIRTQYLEKLDPNLRRLVAVQMGYGGYYGYGNQSGSTYFPSTQHLGVGSGSGGTPTMRVGVTPHGMTYIQP